MSTTALAKPATGEVGRGEIVANYTEETTKLRNLLDSMTRKRLTDYWNIGKVVSAILGAAWKKNELVENMDAACAKFGNKTIDNISEDVGSSVATLRKAMQFYRLVDDQLLAQMLGGTNTRGRPLFVWKTVIALLSVPADKRRHLIESAIARSWDAKEILRKARSLKGEKVDGRQGPKKTNDPVKAFHRFSGHLDTVSERTVIFDEGIALLAKIKEDDDDLRKMATAELRATRGKANALAKILEGFVARADKILKK